MVFYRLWLSNIAYKGAKPKNMAGKYIDLLLFWKRIFSYIFIIRHQNCRQVEGI